MLAQVSCGLFVLLFTYLKSTNNFLFSSLLLLIPPLWCDKEKEKEERKKKKVVQETDGKTLFMYITDFYFILFIYFLDEKETCGMFC